MINLKVTGVGGIKEFADKYLAFLKKEGTDAALYAVRKQIQSDTDRGLDYMGVALEEYADSTKETKRGKGRRISPPNLRDTGDMMNSLTVTPLDGEEMLTVGRKQAKKAQWMIEGRAMHGMNAARNFKDSWLRPPRKFLGINTGNANLMMKMKEAIVRAWNKR